MTEKEAIRIIRSAASEAEDGPCWYLWDARSADLGEALRVMLGVLDDFAILESPRSSEEL